jgi:hypothetical protein
MEPCRRRYGKIFKCCVLRVDFIPRYEVYVCKVFNFFDEGDPKTSRNKVAIGCPLSHPMFVKIFTIHLPNLMDTCDGGM